MHLSRISRYTFIILIFFNILNVSADTKIEHKIAVLVNEELITSYDIIQRIKLSAIVQGIESNSQNNQLLLNNTVEELIYEKLKLEKINEYKVKIEDEEYKEFEIDFFKRNNIDKQQTLDLLLKNKVKYEELKNLLVGELSWNKLVNGLFFRLTSVSDIEIDELISKNPQVSIERAKNLVIQRQLDLKSSKMLRDMFNEATIEYK